MLPVNCKRVSIEEHITEHQKYYYVKKMHVRIDEIVFH